MLSEAQQEARRHGVGASESACLLGLPSFATPIDVFRRLTDPTFQRAETFPMELGCLLEPVVVELAHRRTGFKMLEMPTLKHPSAPMVATPDRLAVTPEGENILVEAKTCSRWQLADWGPDGSDCAPKSYLIQTLHCMHVLRACGYRVERAMIPLLAGAEEFRLFWLRYEPDMAAGIEQACRTFWERHVIANVPPPPDGTPSYSAFLEATYPRAERGPEIVAPDNMNPVAGRYEEALATKKQAEKAQREAEQQLCRALGEAETMVGDGWVARWRADKNGNRRFRLVRGEQ